MTQHDHNLIILPEDSGDDTGVTPSPVNVEIGQWYWAKGSEYNDAGKRVECEWLGCTTHVGSNFLYIEGPAGARRSYATRIHFDDFWTTLRFEPNPEAVIAGKAAHFQAIADKHMNEVRAITARLGVSTQTKLGEAQASKNDNALMVLNGQNHLGEYKSALVLAEKKQLPELFEKIKEAHGAVAAWMTAKTLPMKAMADSMKGTIGEIQDRIFNVSLYAGLTEEVVKCRDGEPAAFHEKLHVMQRMFFMDEECLLNYRHGGMSFDDIEQFDAWLAEDENMNRVLPFERSLVAMRVRRNERDIDWDGSIRSLFVNMRIKQADKLTFLYIRNGEQLHRLSCDLEFGERIFPDRSVFDPSRPSMVKMFCDRIDKIISRDDYDERVKAEKTRKALSAQWRRENPKAAWEATNPRSVYDWADPHRESGDRFNADDWGPFDPSNVYFDEITEHFGDQMKEHNRIALIIQGLFDRSEALHPHPPVKVWSPTSFAASIELVYDGSMVLHYGEAPDFDKYRERCNALLDGDSIVIGQDLFWQEKEAEKECRRLDADYRNKSEWRPKRYKPHGNPGPGYIAKMAEWKPRSRTAKFAWHRSRQNDGSRYSGQHAGDPLYTTITVPAEKLFNVSAYQVGDYKQFFQDPRTRAQYLKWAPLLLAAEEYHSNNLSLTVKQPVRE
jgi:hypothetical protein